MNDKVKNKKAIAIYLLLVFIFLAFISYIATFNLIDPDFGWHLRTGELIMERGAPTVDWYTFTMPDFPWVNHSWFVDVIIFNIHLYFGPQALLLLFLFLSLVPFILLAKPSQFHYFLFPLVLGYLSIITFLGVRPQIFTMIFIVVLIKVIDQLIENRRSLLAYSIPFLFLVWANIHGGFFAGMFILFLYFLMEIFKKTFLFREIVKRKIINPEEVKESRALFFLGLMGLSFLFSLVNPYGIRVYEEIFRSMGDSHLGVSVVEWMPLLSTTNIFQILYISSFLALFFLNYRKIRFDKIILVLTFLAFSLLQQRHFPIFVIISIPIFVNLLVLLVKMIDRNRMDILIGGHRKWAFVFLFLVILSYGLYGFYQMKGPVYPKDALAAIKELPLSDNLFNEYNWGGYLIWKIPERKVFIDGRMPSWRNDGQFAFGDYLKIRRAEDGFEDIIDRYDIDIFLLRNTEKKTVSDYSESKIIDFIKSQDWLLWLLGIDFTKDLKEELISLGWMIHYEDDVSIILTRQN